MKPLLIAACALRGLALPLVAWGAGTGAPARLPAAPRTLTTQFTYRANVPQLPAGVKALNLWIPLPSDGPWQTVRDIKIDAPVAYHITTEHRFGNRMIYLHAADPTMPFSVTVQCVVERKQIHVLADGDQATPPAGDGREALAQYLQPERMVPLGGRYAEIAREVIGDRTAPLDRARALFDHVVATMQYDYKKESPHYAEGDVAFVCDYKKGNCSDLHSYLISLARSLKIPAYLEFGFPLTAIPVPDPLPGEGTIGGYHCWIWLHDPTRGWMPVDASDARRWLDAGHRAVKDSLFGNLVLERSAVAFSRGRDITLSPPQKSEPLNYFIYPYAEADGKTVPATWELRYRLLDTTADASTVSPPRQDLQQQIDALRQLVLAQAEEIRQLRAESAARNEQKPAAAAPAPSPAPITTASGERVGFYGFLRLDAITDSAQTNNTESPLYVQSPSNPNVGTRGNGVANLHPRLTRMGYNFAAPDLIHGTKVTGKIEMDWQNGQGVTVESRPLPRIRHAYLQLQRGPSTWLFGQTWDVISPLFPSPNDDTLQWNVGNIGDRRAQIRYTYAPASSAFSGALAVGLTSAVDAKDLDQNGVRDGEDSSLPNVQARLAWQGKSTTLGIWGHVAWESVTKPVAGRKEFHSYSLGLDLVQRLSARWDLRGELWLGQDLSDFRGGIGQGVNATNGKEIRAHGGWAEVGFRPSPHYRMAVGYTEDNPKDADVPVGGRLKNYSLYLHNSWRLSNSLEVGANYLYWLTGWSGLASGIDHRINGYIQHNF